MTNSKDPLNFYNDLLLASFYSPGWQQYSSFFSLVYLTSNNVSILMFDPPELSSNSVFDKTIDLENIFKS